MSNGERSHNFSPHDTSAATLARGLMIGKAMGKSSTVEASEGLANGKAQRNGFYSHNGMGELS